MKKRLFPIVTIAVIVFALSLAPTASAIFYTCEDCSIPNQARCIARSGMCEGLEVTCFLWFGLCHSVVLLNFQEGTADSKEAFLLSLESQVVTESVPVLVAPDRVE